MPPTDTTFSPPGTLTSSAAPTAELETGWGPRTPAGDTVLRDGLDAVVASWEAVASACGGRAHRGRGFVAVDLGLPTGFMNSATLISPLFGADLDGVVEQVESFYGAGGSGEYLLWSPWPVPDLSARGWSLQGHPPLLYRAPTGPMEAAPPEDLEIVEVTDTAELAEWNATVVEAFPFPDVDPSLGPLGSGVLDDDRFSLLLGRVDGRAMVAGCRVLAGGASVLLLTATRPEARGRGYYGPLVRHRLGSTPDLPVVCLVSDHSRPILVDRFGFLPISRFTVWSRPRP